MYNYNLVQELIASGKTVLNNGFIGGSAALNGNVEDSEYRKSLFIGYTEWMRSVFASGLGNDDRSEVLSRVKDSAIAGIRRYRLIQATAQEAVVVIDEVAVLKAQLAKVEAQRDEAVQVANAAINAYGALAASVRIQANYGVATKTYNEVVSKVGF
jgi:hypothetical protein